MDDNKLLQELNLTAWQPRRAPITLYILFCDHHRRLVNEGLVNLMGSYGTRTWFTSTTYQMLSTTLLLCLGLHSWDCCISCLLMMFSHIFTLTHVLRKLS